MLAMLGICVLGFSTSRLAQDNKRMARKVGYYDTNYLRKQGATSLWSTNGALNYDLRSWDGGKHWYAVTTENDSVIIIGETETVYPGLMRHLSDIDALIKHAETIGPLNPAKVEDRIFMETHGFTITNKSTNAERTE